jgi:hypothetical protein
MAKCRHVVVSPYVLAFGALLVVRNPSDLKLFVVVDAVPLLRAQQYEPVSLPAASVINAGAAS